MPRSATRPAVEHQDLVGVLDRRHPVRDQHRRAPRRIGRRRVRIVALGLGVDRRQRVVEDQDPRVGGQRAGQRDPLALAARQRDAALADQRVVALGQHGDVGRQAGRLGRAPDALVARRRVDLAADAEARCCRRPSPRTGTRPAARSRSAPRSSASGMRVTSRPPMRTAPGRDVLHAQHGVDQRGLARAGAARRSPASRPPAARTTRRPAARRPSATIDRSRTSMRRGAGRRAAAAAPPPSGASAMPGRVVEQLAHARPAGDAALPDADDPAERERRPRQQHQVAVERDQAADASCARDHLAPARPQHDQRADAAQHREQRHQRARAPAPAPATGQVLVVDAAKRRAAARSSSV